MDGQHLKYKEITWLLWRGKLTKFGSDSVLPLFCSLAEGTPLCFGHYEYEIYLSLWKKTEERGFLTNEMLRFIGIL